MVHAARCSRRAARKKLIWRCTLAQRGWRETRSCAPKLRCALAANVRRRPWGRRASQKQRAMQVDAGAQRQTRATRSRDVQPEWPQVTGRKVCLPSCPPEDVCLRDASRTLGAVALHSLSRQRRPIALLSTSSHSRPGQLAMSKKINEG